MRFARPVAKESEEEMQRRLSCLLAQKESIEREIKCLTVAMKIFQINRQGYRADFHYDADNGMVMVTQGRSLGDLTKGS